MSKPKHKSVDMSLPEADRRRPRRNRMVATPPAQMSHAQGSRSSRWSRDGERKFEAERALRGDALPELAEAGSLIDNESEWHNLETARRSLGQD
jgi:hypothetical protein